MASLEEQKNLKNHTGKYSFNIHVPIVRLSPSPHEVELKLQIPYIFDIEVDNAADEIISENNWPDLFPVTCLLTQQETD